MKHTAMAIATILLSVSNLFGQENEHRNFITKLFSVQTDTTYIAEGSNALSIKPYGKGEQGLTSFEYSDTANNVNYSFRINDVITFLVGLNISYKGFSFGYDVNPQTIFHHKHNTGYNLDFCYYGHKLGFDLFFSTKDKAQVRDAEDNKLYDGTVNCFSTSRFQASAYYVLRNNIFSLPAIFTQSMVQKKSAGSLIFGVNATNTLIVLNSSKVPAELDSIFSTSTMFKHFRQTMVGLSCGYGRNIVRQHFLFHWSAQPYLPIYMSKKIRIINNESINSDVWDINIGLKVRGAMHWYYKRHSVNMNLVTDFTIIDQPPLEALDAFVRLYLSYRYVF